MAKARSPKNCWGLLLCVLACSSAARDATRERDAGERVGQKQQAQIACIPSDQCDDDDPCTTDACISLICVNTPILLCCVEDDECEDDEDVCLVGRCLLNECTQVPLLECESGGAGGDAGSGASAGAAGSGDGGVSGEGAGASAGGAANAAGDGGTDAGAGAANPAAGSDAGGSAGGPDGGEGPLAGGGQGPSGGATDGGSAGSAGEGDAGEGDAPRGGSAQGGVASATGGQNASGGDAGSPGNGGNVDDAGEDGGEAGSAGAGGDRSVGYAMEGGGCQLGSGSRRAGRWAALFGVAFLFFAFRRRRALVPWLTAGPLALPGTARAEGFSHDRYGAPPHPGDLLWVERPAPREPHLAPFGRVTLGYANEPLVLVATDDGEEIPVVRDQGAAYLALGVSFLERAHVALLLPAYAQSSDPRARTALGTDVEGAAVGNPGLDGRFVVLDRAQPLELALAATLRFPLGSTSDFVADDGVAFWPRVLVGRAIDNRGSFAGVGMGPLLRPSALNADLRVGTEFRLAAGLLLAVSHAFGLTAELAGSSAASDPFRRETTPLEGMLGIRQVLESVVLSAGLGAGLSSGYGTPDVRALASLAVPAETLEHAPGAAPDLDPDRDGVLGEQDRCPAVAEDGDHFQDDDGCPDLDNDEDGLADPQDRCPLEAEDKDAFADDDGCPDPDNDKDGLADAQDRCPLEAEDKDAFADDDGCPDPDNDKDGFEDGRDQCPLEAETANGVDDEDGCPDFARIEQGQIRTLLPIFFEFGKATIQERSQPLLAEIASLVSSRAELGVISIEGHTDAKGNDDRNLRLSDARAQAVRDFLIRLGVDPARLVARGFGETSPIDDNGTDAGRARNRRVEFRFGAPAPAP